jgi:RNA dependent RNA polymerase
MEVFMRNLPRDLTEDGLQTQLEPFMTRLGIVDYLCEKPRRKPFGNVTFLHRRDGQNFLNVHGQDRPSLKSKLQLMGTQVLCTLSNRPPQDFALKSLQHTVEQREQLSQEVKEEEPSISFNLLSFSCGYCTFVGDQLAYVPEVQWQERGIVRFTKRNMIIKLNNKNHIRIPLNTVVELVWFRDGSLTLTLSEVPIFFSSIPSIEVMMAQLYNTNLNGKIWNTAEANRSRLCALGEKHAEVIGRCLVYQFHVLTDDLSRKIEGLKKREITITRHDLATQKTHMKDLGDFPTQLHALRKELADYTQNNTLPFGVLFQLQALAYNAYLHPVTVLGLAKELRRIMKVDQAAGKSFISVDAMRKLFDMIDWPSPHGNPMDFEVSSLVAALKQNGQEIQDGFEQRAGLFGPTANMARINRVMITPTRITLHGPEMEPNNRILRKFPNHHEHFIRAQFCDENGQDLYFNTRISYDDIYARFKLALKHGIQIAGRMYKFLGFSHSSLRSHSVWVSFTT